MRTIAKILLSCVAGALVASSIARAEEFTREVRLALDPVKDAVRYEIDVQKTLPDGSKAEASCPKTAKTAKWECKLAPGRYVIKTRAVDRRGVPGTWSEPQAVAIRLPPVTSVAPKEDAIVKPSPQADGAINFSWQEIAGADDYLLEVEDEDGKKLATLKTNKTSLDHKLPRAKAYTYKVTAIDAAGDPGEAQEEAVGFAVLGEKLKRPVVKPCKGAVVSCVTWSKSPNATSYKVDLQRQVGPKKWADVTAGSSVKKTSFALDDDLEPGRYRARVRALATYWQDSPSAAVEFTRYGRPEDGPLGPEKLRFSAAVTPSFWTYNVSGEGVQELQLSGFFGDAQVFSIRYWPLRKLGLDLGYKRLTVSLFENEKLGAGEATAAQDPIEVERATGSLALLYRLGAETLALDLRASYAARTSAIFSSTDGEIVKTSPVRINEVGIGATAHAMFWSVYTFETAVDFAKATSQKGVSSPLALHLSSISTVRRPIGFQRLMLGPILSWDRATYEVDSGGGKGTIYDAAYSLGLDLSWRL